MDQRQAGHFPRSATRRQLLKGAAGATALALAPGVLAACGSSSSTAASKSTSTSAVSGTVGGTLDYIGWEGEDFKELLAPWLQKNAVNIQSSYVNNMSDISAKYAAGGGGNYDIINLSSNCTARLIESGVPLGPIDLERLPNSKGLISFFQDEPTLVNEAGELVAVPTCWGTLGITYDASQIKAPTAWSDLLEPEFKGKITIIDDPSTVFGLAVPLLGYQANELTADQFEKTKAYVRQVVAQVKTISPTFGDMANLLVSGEVVAAWAGYGAVTAFAREAGSNDIETEIELTDGGVSFAECYGVPTSGQNPATAYSMIDELLTPANDATIANTLINGPSIEGAIGKVNKTIRNLYPITGGAAQITSFLETRPLSPDPPVQSSEFTTFAEFTEAWNEIKAGIA